MDKRILELNISEENKILISKIEKRINLLSVKAQNYFDKSLLMPEDKMKKAYSNNEDLISILEQNDEIAFEIKKIVSDIKEQHHTNFTREQTLNVSKEVDDLSIIKNTVNYKENMVTAADKMILLNKRTKYLKHKNARRKEEYNKELDSIKLKMKNEEILDITPMKDDIKLINKLIDPDRLSTGKTWYFVNIILLLITVIIIGAVIWVAIN